MCEVLGVKEGLVWRRRHPHSRTAKIASSPARSIEPEADGDETYTHVPRIADLLPARRAVDQKITKCTRMGSKLAWISRELRRLVMERHGQWDPATLIFYLPDGGLFS